MKFHRDGSRCGKTLHYRATRRRSPFQGFKIRLRRHGLPEDPVFPSIRGGRLSRDAIECLITKYTHLAAQTCHLKQKRVSPHVLRHAAAMDLLQHGADRPVIALWLGDGSVETTQTYLHADMRLKEKALSHTKPLGIKTGAILP